jgi:glycosyltransferase involved in cell wall biosynthesis
MFEVVHLRSGNYRMAVERARSPLLPTFPAATVQSQPTAGPARRVLIIAYTHYIFDARVKRHAEALAQQGYAVDVICLADEHEPRWVRIIGIPMPRYRGHSRAQYLYQYIRFFTKATYTAARLNHKQSYDVVIVCSIPDAAIVSGLIPRFSGSKLILDVHDTMPELYLEKFPGAFGEMGAAALRLEERVSARMADLVFAVHDLHAERLEASGIPREKIVVILNTADPRLFQRVGCSKQSDRDDFTVVTHGTINRRLGLDTALEAMSLVRNRIPRIKFRIIGPGEHRESVRQHARRLDLDGIVQFEDAGPLEGLAEALRGASLGLVPNAATAATQLMLPVKLLEYVSLGIPVIASSLRTIRHYFPEDAVRYFQPANAQSLAESLTHLYLHPEERLRLASCAGEAAESICWENQRQTLCRTIELLIAGKNRDKAQAKNRWLFRGRNNSM